MKFDVTLLNFDLTELPRYVQAAEDIGFDGFWLAETTNDPFLGLTLAAEHSQTMTLGTAIAVAFPRSPAVLAYTGWGLAKLSRGRVVIGLGTQVKGHIERRFGMTWEKPAQKMRETIRAMRAFWDCWQYGVPLKFQGEFFRHDLMTPFFDPGPHDYPHIPIYVSGVNKLMCRLAGELCDGLHIHALHTRKYLDELVIPAVEEGLQISGRDRSAITLSTAIFAIPTDDDQSAQYDAYARQQISFYMSTPAYAIITELHGWQSVSQELRRLAARGRWQDMPSLISDDILAEFALRGTWAEIPHLIKQKYGDRLDRIGYYLSFTPGEKDDAWRRTIAAMKGDGD